MKAFRFPQIGGDSQTGDNMQLDSFLMMRFFAYLYLGFMHKHSIAFNFLPVDQCASLSLELFFNPNTGYEMFNVLNPTAGTYQNTQMLGNLY